MANVYHSKDADRSLMNGRKVAILGYGSQGHAHALNLFDSGINVVVGLRDGSSSWDKACEAGLPVMRLDVACAWADLIMVLAPDTEQATLYSEFIKPNLEPGNALFFAHGFCIRYEQIVPPAGIDVCLVAPKGPGHLVRSTYVEGGGVPCLIATTPGSSAGAHDLALAYADCIGAGEAGVLDTTFDEETETDLFGEQTILCGLLLALMQMCFEVLVEAGYQPESAYFECIHELKLIVDLVYEGGASDMLFSISDTAKWGCLTTGPKLIDEGMRDRLRQVLAEIQDGSFAANWIFESGSGRAEFNRLLAASSQHPSEVVGAELRALMPFINPAGNSLRSASGGTT